MKKIYTLSLLLMSFVGAFAQTFYSENFGTPPSGNPLVTAYTGWQNVAPTSSVTYLGNASVRTSNASSGYTGASGGGNIFLNNGQTFEIHGLNTAAYSTANLTLTFGFKQDQGPAEPANNLTLQSSVNEGATWENITYTRTGNTWQLVTVSGSQIPSDADLWLRWTNIGVAPAQNQFRIDDVKLSNVSANCLLDLGDATTVCNAVTGEIDTYTVSIPFTGGGTATYGMVATLGTIAGDNPSTMSSGVITITNVNEGFATSITITGGDCNITLDVNATSCKPINTLPYNESFDYGTGTPLTGYQKWREINSGDSPLITVGNLSYAGMPSTGNSVAFSGSGAEAYSPFTATTSGSVYAAFLMSVTDMGNVTTDGTSTYFAGLLADESTTSYNTRLHFKKNGAQYNIGLSSGATGSTAAYNTTALNEDDTVMIIMGFDYNTNTHSVWVNPDMATFSASTPATLTETVTTAPADFGGFILRQEDNDTTPTITIDELRIVNNLAALSVRSNDIAGFAMYPNPLSGNMLTITSASNAPKAVAIYDVLGKEVVNTVTNNNVVNVNGLTSGIYMVKITEEGKTATRKLVVR